MRFARSILSAVFFLSYGAAALAFAPLIALPVWNANLFRAIIRAFYRVFVFFAHVTGLFTVTVQGQVRRSSSRGRIVVMNHVSLIDIVVLLAKLGDATAIAKAAVRRNPFLGLVAKRMFIINDQDAAAMLEEVRRFLDSGVDVIVFPQGTRGGGKFHRGAARLALGTHANILPAVISYDPVVLAKGQPWWDVGPRIIRIRLCFHDEITPVGPDTRANALALIDDLRQMLVPDSTLSTPTPKQSDQILCQ